MSTRFPCGIGIGTNTLKKLGLKFVSLNGSTETSWTINLPEFNSNFNHAFGLPVPELLNLPIISGISPSSAELFGISTSPKKKSASPFSPVKAEPDTNTLSDARFVVDTLSLESLTSDSALK